VSGLVVSHDESTVAMTTWVIGTVPAESWLGRCFESLDRVEPCGGPCSRTDWIPLPRSLAGRSFRPCPSADRARLPRSGRPRCSWQSAPGVALDGRPRQWDFPLSFGRIDALAFYHFDRIRRRSASSSARTSTISATLERWSRAG
jgi:hypothetical protein